MTPGVWLVAATFVAGCAVGAAGAALLWGWLIARGADYPSETGP